MAHFAKLDENNVVLEVNVVNNDDIQNLPFPESEPVGIQFLANWSGGYTNWKQTSYNGNFRKNYAGIGYTYRSDIDAFVPPQPFPSWTLNNENAEWQPPVPYPTQITMYGYMWNEGKQQWEEITNGS
jgi:hypothetical protein